MKRVNVHLSNKELQELEKLSLMYDLSRAELVRRAVDQFLRVNRDQGATGILNYMGI